MKNFIVKIYFVLIVCAFFAFTKATTKLFSTKVDAPVSKSVEIVSNSPLLYVELDFGVDLKGHEAFLGAIGLKESSNDYKSVNRLGYMGRYQFGKKTLNSLGIKVSRKEFLNNPELQEQAMDKLLQANYNSLKKYIDKYEGKVLHGVLITKSGVLAAAHLGGAGSVRRWFRKGIDFKDANGTSITKYMNKFNGYKLNI
jgi:hypothetical protein